MSASTIQPLFRSLPLPRLVLAGLLLMLGTQAQAASLDGSQLSLAWAVPFVGILLSIAIWPLAGPHFWHHHFGKVAAGWAPWRSVATWYMWRSLEPLPVAY